MACEWKPKQFWFLFLDALLIFSSWLHPCFKPIPMLNASADMYFELITAKKKKKKMLNKELK